MNQDEIEKWRILMPEHLITVTVELNSEDLAEEMYEQLRHFEEFTQYPKVRLNRNRVTAVVGSWAGVHIVESSATRASVNVYERKFGPIK